MEKQNQKTVIGAHNRRFTMQQTVKATTIRYNCRYANAWREIPILISDDGIHYRKAEGGTPRLNEIITQIITENDFSVRFPNIIIEA